jgi:transcriptional regulator
MAREEHRPGKSRQGEHADLAFPLSSHRPSLRANSSAFRRAATSPTADRRDINLTARLAGPTIDIGIPCQGHWAAARHVDDGDPARPDAAAAHGYAIAQRIHQTSGETLRVEEGSLYPALQKLLIKGWVKAEWRESDSGRQVREYRITAGGRKQLGAEVAEYRRMATAIGLLLDEA